MVANCRYTETAWPTWACARMHEIPWVLLETQLLVDLHYFELHLGSCKFKYEDKRTAADLFSMRDCFFKFDYKSSYQLSIFQFLVFPFSLLTGPYLFIKIQQTLVKYWRAKGFHIFTYLDGAHHIWDNAVEIPALVFKDIVLSRFVPKDEKSQSVPTEILGLYNGFTMWKFSGAQEESANPQAIDRHDDKEALYCLSKVPFTPDRICCLCESCPWKTMLTAPGGRM